MSQLVPIRRNELEVGKAVPWPVYDRQNHLLLRAGYVLQSQRQIELLWEKGLFHSPEWTPSRAAGIQAVDAPKKRLPPPPPPPDSNQISFLSMKLSIGDMLQMSPSGRESVEKYYVKFIGHLEKRSILVTAPIAEGKTLFVKPGQNFTVRAFSGKNVYTFSTSVLDSHSNPYPYLHLVYPASVNGIPFRKAQRIKVSLPAQIISVPHPERGQYSARLVDLSATGTMLESTQSLGAPDEQVSLHFTIRLEHKDLELALTGRIRNVQNAKNELGNACLHHGVEFEALEFNHSLMLKNYIYQHILEGI